MIKWKNNNGNLLFNIRVDGNFVIREMVYMYMGMRFILTNLIKLVDRKR